jgi:hypothetical protein
VSSDDTIEQDSSHNAACLPAKKQEPAAYWTGHHPQLANNMYSAALVQLLFAFTSLHPATRAICGLALVLATPHLQQ